LQKVRFNQVQVANAISHEHLVARLVHFLRRHLVGKTIGKVSAIDDKNVFGKVGTSGSEFEEEVKGKKVTATERTATIGFG
jgi:formamidopyrimidine-DNA glycosylase